jgi:hypothetical protein
MHVISNGRIMFGSTGDTDYSPTVAEALADDPFAGLWIDVSPNVGGAITVSTPAVDTVRVDYVNVPFYGNSTLTNTFGIEINATTGIIQIDGIAGVQSFPVTVGTNPEGFLGVSRGNTGATNAGATAWIGGFNAGPANGTDMVYNFTVTPNTSGATLGNGYNTIQFIPNASGNYDYNAF